MRTIDVDGDAIDILGGAVAADLVALFDDENFFASFFQKPRQRGAGEAGTDDKIVIFLCHKVILH